MREHNYGMDAEAYQQMLVGQRGVCVICHRPSLDGKPLRVDHSHATGRVRALLCHPCNVSLGLMQDNPDRLRAAAAFLEQHESAH